MARRRKTKSKREPLDPQDVLAGRVEFRAEDLFDLIHQVNPTRRKLSAKESARRYTLKRRLQSLLIRRFGDDDLVVKKTENGGVVSLDHRSGLRDACHTVTAELEPDARSWVQRQLDLAARGVEADLPELQVAPEPGEEEGGEGVAELLLRGRRALEEYDYERAEELMERAFATSRGSLVPSRAAAAAESLLELRVEMLGMDEAALQLEPRLSATEKENAGIRTLLALAAARSGETERALIWVAGSTPADAPPQRLAEIHAALASQAIADGERHAARRHRDQVAEYEPTHPQLPTLAEGIAELRARDLRRAEAALELRCQQVGAAAVEDEARALANRWPEGEVARRILRQLAADRRQAEIREHLEQGTRARGEKRFADAARYFQAALDAGSDRSDLPALIEEAAGRARQERDRAELERVLGLFGESVAEPAPQEALSGYLALGARLRARVREKVTAEALGWLEELGAPRSGHKAQAAVSAVQALERARLALERGEAEAAVAEIVPHRSTLRSVDAARELWQAARQRVVLEHQRRAREMLDDAVSTLRDGQATRSRRLLDEVPRGDLEPADLARAHRLEQRLDATDALERLQGDYDRFMAEGELTAALRCARDLARRTGEKSPEEARRWRRSYEELQSRIRADWQLEEVSEPPGAEQLISPSRWPDSTVAWLDPAGREMVFANAWQRWVFIDTYDAARGRITARVSFCTPRPLETPLIVRRTADRLWMAGRAGDVLEIDPESWNVLGFYPLAEFLTGDRDVDRVWLLPGERWAWMRVIGIWEADQIFVVDLRRWRLSRRWNCDYNTFDPAILGGEPVMLTGGLRVYGADGELRLTQHLEDGEVLEADVGPDGRGLLALVTKPEPSDDAADSERDSIPKQRRVLLRLAESADGEALQPVARLELPDAHPHYGFYAVLTSPELGRTYAWIYNRDHDQELLVFARDREVGEPGRLAPVTRSLWSSRTTLVHDERVRHVGAMKLDWSRVALHDLDAPPVRSGPKPAKQINHYPTYKVYSHSCGRPTGDFGAAVVALAEELEERRAGALRTRLAGIEASETAEVDEQLKVALAMLRLNRQRELGDALTGFASRMADRHPRHSGVLLLAAELAALEEEWEEVRRILRRSAPKGLDAGRERHYHHLVALAGLHCGRLEEAHAACKRGLAVDEGTCDLEALKHLTQPMSDPPLAEEWSPDQPTIRRIVGAIRTADHALAHGDTAAARAALDRRDVRWQQELQSAARRAKAYLAAADELETAAERFDERSALAFFSHVRQQETWLRHDLVMPGLQWDEEKLDELAERVGERLEELGGERDECFAR